LLLRRWILSNTGYVQIALWLERKVCKSDYHDVMTYEYLLLRPTAG
jgi:hypothetical protein